MCHSGVVPNDDDDLLTSTQAGALLGKSGKTVIRLAHDGLIPVAHHLTGPNGAYLFRRSDIERLLVDQNRSAS